MDQNQQSHPRLDELVPVRELQPRLERLFPTRGSLDWELRINRREYIAGGALYEIAGRLLAHAPTFERIALAIGSRKLSTRHGLRGES